MLESAGVDMCSSTTCVVLLVYDGPSRPSDDVLVLRLSNGPSRYGVLACR